MGAEIRGDSIVEREGVDTDAHDLSLCAQKLRGRWRKAREVHVAPSSAEFGVRFVRSTFAVKIGVSLGVIEASAPPSFHDDQRVGWDTAMTSFPCLDIFDSQKIVVVSNAFGSDIDHTARRDELFHCQIAYSPCRFASRLSPVRGRVNVSATVASQCVFLLCVTVAIFIT